MQIAIGTYEGSLHFLTFRSQQLHYYKSLQLSQNSIKSLCSINNQYLVAGGYDQQIRVIDMNTHQERVQAKQNIGQITQIVQADDKHFVCGVDDGTLRLWDTTNWAIQKQQRVHKKPVSGIVVGKGKLMISSGGNKVVVWSVQGLKKMHEYKFGQDLLIQNIFLSPCLKSLYISTSKSQIIHISTTTNKQTLLLSMPMPRKIQSFHIFKQFIVVANDIGEVMAWRLDNIEENQQIMELSYEKRIWFQAHQSRIKDMKVVNDQWLIIGTAAGDVSIWDFPIFLDSVQAVSQQYFLEGLKPVCAYHVKGRILCLEAILHTKGKNQQTSKINQKIDYQQKEQQQHEVEQRQEGKAKPEKKKSKLIKKKAKMEVHQHVKKDKKGKK